MTWGSNFPIHEPSKFQPIERFKTFQYDDLLGTGWTTIYDHDCDFNAEGFFQVAHFLIRNPNISSSTLFRADILYDSDGTEHIDAWTASTPGQLKKECPDIKIRLPHHQLKRRIIRRFIPRNDGLDKLINQSVLYYTNISEQVSRKKNLVILIPHIRDAKEIPFYHPRVAGIVFTHTSGPDVNRISISYNTFTEDIGQPLSDRQIRTAYQLLKTTWKYGQGNLAGYKKRIHHDQIIPQRRVQDRFASLKRKYASRLIANWVEVMAPSKQIYEQIGIAAFLLELWTDMYKGKQFPGFVDIGCGNGILVEILLSEGYKGYGLEGYRRKTWPTMSPRTQRALVHAVVVPAPLNYMDDRDMKHTFYEVSSNPGLKNLDNTLSVSRSLRLLSKKMFSNDRTKDESSLPPLHNGLFNSTPEAIEGPFLISNHADELTGWTPFMALLNRSSFFIVPCCSRNLSGERFRAPSHVNNFTADTSAPPYFQATMVGTFPLTKKKHIPIRIPDLRIECNKFDSHNQNSCVAQLDDSPLTSSSDVSEQASLESRMDKESRYHFVNAVPLAVLSPPADNAKPIPEPSSNGQVAETGDLKKLSRKVRTKNLSGYQALCCWVVHLADKCGYLVEREMLRLPSTRNLGIVGRFMKGDFELQNQDDNVIIHQDLTLHERMEKVIDLIEAEGGAQKSKWLDICEKEIIKGKDLLEYGA